MYFFFLILETGNKIAKHKKILKSRTYVQVIAVVVSLIPVTRIKGA